MQLIYKCRINLLINVNNIFTEKEREVCRNERINFKWQTRQDKTRQDKTRQDKTRLRYVKNGDFLGIFESRKGITLISLVITIIIMAILAGVSVSMLTADNSIVRNAAEAKTSYENASAIEQIKLAMMGAIDLTGNYNIDKAVTGIQTRLRGSTVNKTGTQLVVEYKNNKYIVRENEVSTIDKLQKANPPVLKTGMTPVKISDDGTITEVAENDTSWYDYGELRWANAQTEDGSLWVWVRQLGG